MPNLQTGSITTGPQGQDATLTALSPLIVVKVGNNPVGAIQSITITEERQITMVDEVGTDGHIDSAPSRSTNISIDCTRIRFDRMRITEAFSRDYLHIHSQRIPFDIEIYDNWQGNGNNAIITTIKNVWIGRLNVRYQAENFIIADEMSGQAETIYSTLNGKAVLASGHGGIGGMQLDVDSIELDADQGNRLGSLDAPDLIDAYFGGSVP